MKKNIKILIPAIICCFLLSACSKENEILLSNKETVDLINGSEMEKVARDEDQTSDKDQTSDEETFSETITETFYYIHICGAIVNPGVYEVVEGTRLYEAINLAGGLTSDASEDYVNQALLIEDGQKLYIPTVSELENGDFKENKNTNLDNYNIKIDDNLVNINTALAEELCSLPGIGSSRAQDIITYREQNGDFKTIEEIQKVTGIKEGLFSKIKSLITV